MDYKKYIEIVEDFPVEGISFKDITTLLANGPVFKQACDDLKDFVVSKGATKIIGPESRGFIFGCPIAKDLSLPFIPVRKPGKLPRETISIAYTLEYGENVFHMNKDAISKGDKVVIVDDLLATGGTVESIIKLVESLGGVVVGCCFLAELTGLKARDLLKDYDLFSLVDYEF